MTTQTELKAETLAESILAAVELNDDLRQAKTFSELHDFCDANTLGETEWYFDNYGVVVVELAQTLVGQKLPLS